MDSASGKTIGGQEIGGNRRDTIPKGAFLLPIVLGQVKPGNLVFEPGTWLSCCNNHRGSGNAGIPGARILLLASDPEQWPETPRSAQISIAPPGQDKELHPPIPAGISALFVLKGFLSLESRGRGPGAKKGGKNTWRRICGAEEGGEEVGKRMGRGCLCPGTQRVLKWDLDFAGRQEGTQRVHGARQEQSRSCWDEPWEQQVGAWDKSPSFGVSRKAQGGFGPTEDPP